MIRVLIVDDAVAVRGLIRKAISEAPGMEVASTAANGVQALEEYKRTSPDVVIMDIEMPEMNGIDALRAIKAHDPSARVIMCSALTHKGAEITLNALEIGALDYLLKPSASSIFSTPETFNRDLIEKIRAVTASRVQTTSMAKTAAVPDASLLSGPCATRPMPPDFHQTDIIAIGSSTGGVQALFQVLEDLGTPNVPILITQHMPPTFTHMLATHIGEKTKLRAFEAADGMKVESNTAYIAPGGRHMEVVGQGDDLFIHLTDTPPENFCRPSVDPMMRSLLAHGGRRKIMTIILTGMGNDGQNGARQAVEGGHVLVAQDEATSVVWGMPGAVAKEGLCHAILPIGDIGAWVGRYTKR